MTISTFYQIPGALAGNGGGIWSVAATYADARAGNGTVNGPNTTQIIGQRPSFSGQPRVDQALIAFPTGSLGIVLIDDVSLQMYGNGDVSSTDFVVQVREGLWRPPASSSDFVPGNDLGGLDLLATLDTNNFILDDFNEFAENGTALRDYVSTTDDTYLVVCSDRTVAGTAPSNNEYVQFFRGTSQNPNDPMLIIEHTDPITPEITQISEVSYGEYPGAFDGNPGSLTFTATDSYDDGVNELTWQVRTASGGGGTLVRSGLCTSGIQEPVTIQHDDPGLTNGSQTLYLRVIDPHGLADEEAFSFNVVLTAESELELVWGVSGQAQVDFQLVWGLGGVAYTERAIVWEVAPAPTRVTYALTGETGPTRFNMRYRRVTPTGLFLQDVSNAFTGYPRISSNNDRQVFRVASFTIDPDATDDLGNPITLRPFVDQVAVSMDLLVDGDYWLNIPMGTYAIQAPTRFMTTRGEDWQIEAPDLTIRLVEQMTDSLYVVPESTNYITAVRDIFDLLGLPHNFPPTEAVTIKDETYLPATPWVTVVNDLLQKAGYYIHWFDRRGRATSRQLGDVSTRTPDVAYTGNDFLLSSITEEVETTRFANQIIVTAESPDQDGLVVVATNNDPDSPVSTVNLGYIRSKVIPMSGATLEAMEEKAAYELSQSDSVYTRSTIETLIDPRRDGREVYNVDAPWADYDNDRWQVRNTDVDLRPGGVMRHVLSKVRRVMADIETVGGE